MSNPSRSRILDLLYVVTVIPVLVMMGILTRAAWRSYHPKRRPSKQTPETFGLTAQRVKVPGADGLEIACWSIPAAEDSEVVVVLGHGIGRNSGSMMGLAKSFHDAGYHVFTFDLRNHGETPDDGLLRGQSPRYGIDHHKVVLHVKERFPQAKVACLGVSMSAWTALECGRKEPELVRAVIADSGPTLDVVATTARMFDATKGVLPRFIRGPVMSRIGRWWLSRSAMFFLKPAPWPMEFTDHTIKVLFIGGEKDPVSRPEDIREQMKWYPNADSWFVPNAGHANASLVASDEYVKRVLAVLSEAFPR